MWIFMLTCSSCPAHFPDGTQVSEDLNSLLVLSATEPNSGLRDSSVAMAVTAQGLTGPSGATVSLQKDLVWNFSLRLPGPCRWFCLFSKGVLCGFTCSRFLGAGKLPDAGTRPPPHSS